MTGLEVLAIGALLARPKASGAPAGSAAPGGGISGGWRAAGEVSAFVGGGGAFAAWTAGAAIDADGAPNAYRPDGRGLDATASGGHPGNWWGVVTDTGESDGDPVVLSNGSYVSTNKLVDAAYGRADQQRYGDATRVPFVALGPDVLSALGANIHDLAFLVNLSTGAAAGAIVGDIAPHGHAHEVSMAAASLLGIPTSPRGGGVGWGIGYVLFPGTATGWPRPGFEAEAAALFASLVGFDNLFRITGA